MSEVMASKLRHAQDTMAAVMQADFDEIEVHAIALQRISAESMTLSQDTVTYSVLADRFREVAGALASRAAARDLDGVTASYNELSGTCVACPATSPARCRGACPRRWRRSKGRAREPARRGTHRHRALRRRRSDPRPCR
jgi:hypothetical protein